MRQFYADLEAVPLDRSRNRGWLQLFDNHFLINDLNVVRPSTMRVELIGHFKPCMTEIYLHIDARMAYYIHTHP